MTVKEIENEIETVNTQVAKATRGDDTKILVGLLVRGIWQVALEIAELNEKNPIANG